MRNYIVFYLQGIPIAACPEDNDFERSLLVEDLFSLGYGNDFQTRVIAYPLGTILPIGNGLEVI